MNGELWFQHPIVAIPAAILIALIPFWLAVALVGACLREFGRQIGTRKD